MFGKNQRISQMQISRMLALQLLGTGILLPSVLANSGLAKGTACIAVGAAAAGVLCLLVQGPNSRIPSAEGKNSCEPSAGGPNSRIPSAGGKDHRFLFVKWKNWRSPLAGCVYGVYLFLLGGIVLCKMVEILQVIFLPQAALPFLAVVLVLAALYAVWNGVEAQVRIFDIWFWFCVICICAVLLAWFVIMLRQDWQPVSAAVSGGAVRSVLAGLEMDGGILAEVSAAVPGGAARSVLAGLEMDGEILAEALAAVSGGVARSGVSGFAFGCLASFLSFLPVLQCVELNRYKNIEARTRKSLLFVLALTAAASAAFFTILQLAYGTSLAGKMPFPYLVLVSDIGILKKALAFLVAAVLSALFCVLTAAAGYGARRMAGKHAGKAAFFAVVSAAVLLVLGIIFYRYEWNHSDWARMSGVAAAQEESWQPGSHEIENQAFPVALGLDVSDTGEWRIFFCFVQGKSNGEQEEEPEEEQLFFCLEAGSMDEVEKKLKELEKGNLNTVHIQAVVLSERLLQENGKMQTLCENWLSLKMRAGSALCFRTQDVEKDLQAFTKKLETYSAWEKLSVSQREENGGKKVTFSQVMVRWNYSADNAGWADFIPALVVSASKF